MKRIKNSFRLIRDNLASSIIMVIGISCCLIFFTVIIEYLSYENSFDEFHKDSEDIYRADIEAVQEGKSDFHVPMCGRLLGPLMKEEIPEVEEFVRMFSDRQNVSVEKNENKFFESSILYVDSNFFNFFSFPLITGDSDKVLKNYYSCVISEEIKDKYFGKENPVGNTLLINDINYIVDGVCKNVPQNSHFKFDILLSNNDILELDVFQEGWEAFAFYTYLKLMENSNKEEIQSKLRSLVNRHKGKDFKQDNIECKYSLQRLTEIHLNSNLEYELDTNGNKNVLWFWVILVIFILIQATINNANIVISGLTRRFKEIGLRKMHGSSVFNLSSVLLKETIIIILFAGGVSLLIRELFDQVFRELLFGNRQPVSTEIWFRLTLLFSLMLIFLFVNWSSIILFLTNLNYTDILHGKNNASNNKLKLRKRFMSFQIFVMIVVFFSVVIVYKQYDFLINYKDLGYNKENLHIIKSAGHDPYKINILKQELLNMPEIELVTTSSGIPGKTYSATFSIRLFGENEDINNLIKLEVMDESFIDAYKIKLLSGKNFRQYSDNSNRKVILNNSACKLLGFSPKDAIEQFITIEYFEGKYEIIGVCNDYHHQSLGQVIEPQVFMYRNLSPGYISIKLKENTIQTSTKIKEDYKKLFPDHIYEGFNFNDYYFMQYSKEENIKSILLILTIVIVIIAGLGIYGISIFLIRARTKEIALRKIAGATSINIFGVLLKPTAINILISSALAIPIGYYFVHKWLENYASKIDITWYFIILPVVITFFIVFITIIHHIVKVNNEDLSLSLRRE